MAVTAPAGPGVWGPWTTSRHDLSVTADGWVLVLTCSCGGLRLECEDDSVPLVELIRRGEDHRHAYAAQAELAEHLAAGHATRGRADGLHCSCGHVWPLEAVA